MAARVLIVEDEPELRLGLELNLRAEGFDPLTSGDGAEALRICGEERLDLVLLDLRLPSMDGIEVLRRLRVTQNDVPVICVTARAEEEDRIRGLDVGADDYVTKPFSMDELVARIRAVLRRRPPSSDVVDLGGASICLSAREIRRDGEVHGLTPTEAEIVTYLVQRLDDVVTRASMLQDLWGLEPTHSTRTLDNHIARIRKKLEVDVTIPRMLLTVHGEGYRLVRSD